jgi:hypothetical protein
MIYVGMDDTDTIDTRGTNQLAKALVRQVAGRFRCLQIVRHQLLNDPRVPFTSQNGSASLLFEPLTDGTMTELISELRSGMLADFIVGSDPGLCVSDFVPQAAIEWAHRCQRELVHRQQAYDIAAANGVYLEGLGGTEDGVIGSLAAIGLAVERNDGRVVQMGDWPDDLSGPTPIEAVLARGIDVLEMESGKAVSSGWVDVGKHLRPNIRAGRYVLFIQPIEPEVRNQSAHPEVAYYAVKLK